IRATSAPAGRLAASMPRLSTATTAAAVATSAPRSRARSASTGITAPCPTELTTEGPYATHQMSRSRNSVSAGGVTSGRLVARATWGGEVRSPLVTSHLQPLSLPGSADWLAWVAERGDGQLAEARRLVDELKAN